MTSCLHWTCHFNCHGNYKGIAPCVHVCVCLGAHIISAGDNQSCNIDGQRSSTKPYVSCLFYKPNNTSLFQLQIWSAHRQNQGKICKLPSEWLLKKNLGYFRQESAEVQTWHWPQCLIGMLFKKQTNKFIKIAILGDYCHNRIFITLPTKASLNSTSHLF